MSQREFTIADEYRYDRRSPLRWILSHIWRYPHLPLTAMAGFVVGSALYSFALMQVGAAFDLIVARPELGALLVIALTIVAARLSHGLSSLLAWYATEFTAQRLERDARAELYVSLLGKSQTFHNRQKVGDVMARATNDVQQMNMMVSPGASLIYASLASTVVPLLAIALLRWQLLLVPMLFLAAFVPALRHYSRELNPVTGRLRFQFGALNAGLAEAVSGIEVVKAYAQEAQEQGKFSAAARGYRDLFVEQGRIQARYLPLLLYGVAFGLSFGHAALLFLRHELSVGEAVAFLGLFSQLRFPTFISLFSFLLVELGISGAERILGLINDETELDENAAGHRAPIRGEIVFDGVSFGYGAAEPASDAGGPARGLNLRGITFTARPGETVAIVGQTGAGKTTLTHLVNRTYDTTEGRVLVDGVDVREWSLDALRAQISTIEQDVFLFSRSIADNIAFGAAGQATREQIERAAHEAQAHDFIMGLPDGYDTIIGERGVTLSGGQRQRIAIARAFLTDPRILILDDSTSAIDSATEDQIQRAMRRILRGRTTLLITHRISQIRWADRILVLRGGDLAAQGTHDELMASSEAYRRIFARYAGDPAAQQHGDPAASIISR
ncbi:MAG: ABC transporter ATP-binding protein [Chloroflexales bacterium]|nr:ABC transporter ATP-binding protein [Chloroflexales bacterium]